MRGAAAGESGEGHIKPGQRVGAPRPLLKTPVVLQARALPRPIGRREVAQPAPAGADSRTLARPPLLARVGQGRRPPGVTPCGPAREGPVPLITDELEGPLSIAPGAPPPPAAAFGRVARPLPRLSRRQARSPGLPSPALVPRPAGVQGVLPLPVEARPANVRRVGRTKLVRPRQGAVPSGPGLHGLQTRLMRGPGVATPQPRKPPRQVLLCARAS